jgi:spore coat protein U-like protein
MDVSQASPFFLVRDIISPFGLLRDSIPIPGPVVQAMSESIDELMSQFPPNILIGPPSSLTFNVDEGRGFSVPVTVIVTNDGVYGSLLNVSLASSAAYLVTQPATLGNLAFNEAGEFEAMVDSTSLLTANSPYNETITLQDASAVNNPQVLPVTIIVRPKATIDATPLTLTFTVAKPLVGPFPPLPTQQFTLENIGPAGSVLDYQIQRLTGLSDKWLASFSPVSGTLTSAQTQPITVGVAPQQACFPGTYTETLRISGYSTNLYVDVLITLIITP